MGAFRKCQHHRKSFRDCKTDGRNQRRDCERWRGQGGRTRAEWATLEGKQEGGHCEASPGLKMATEAELR